MGSFQASSTTLRSSAAMIGGILSNQSQKFVLQKQSYTMLRNTPVNFGMDHSYFKSTGFNSRKLSESG